MRTLIFGAKGQLGRDLIAVFRRDGEVRGFDLPELDVADAERVAAVSEQFRPDLVINAAAYTDVEAAETALEAAFLANETGARNIAEAAAYHHAPVVYYSTDFVFDGARRTPYPPDAPISPISVYGRSKAAGEAATAKANPAHYILRTAWLYGPGGNNFVEKVLKAAFTRPELRVVEDETGSPTHTLDLAEATLAAVRKAVYGTYHVTNAGQCSRFEFAREILLRARIDTPIFPCSVADFPVKAQRPAYSVLDTAAFVETTGHALRSWTEALQDYLNRRETYS